MKKIILAILSLIPICCYAQLFKHISIEDGLSSRRIFSMQKDSTGYMWFLTKEGVDRYDGSAFKNYSLNYEGKEINSQVDISWFYMDKEGTLRLVGKKGMNFKYNKQSDSFEVAYEHPAGYGHDIPPIIRYSFIDDNNYIWLCGDNYIHRCNFSVESASTLKHNLGTITKVAQYDDNHYFIGTETQVFFVELCENRLNVIPIKALDELYLQANELYYDSENNQLFIGSFQRGLFVYDTHSQSAQRIDVDLTGVPVTRILPLNKNKLLVATDGAGIYMLDRQSKIASAYIVADFEHENLMTGNNITDMYIDDEQRIWLANYPLGITIFDKRFPSYKWIRHHIGNPQSLVNNYINAIIEDSDKDIWFATNNGISIYKPSTKQWKSLLSTVDSPNLKKTSAIFTLCEVQPGIVYAAGHNANILKVNKKTMEVTPLTVHSYSTVLGDEEKEAIFEKNIQSIYKDKSGLVWIGGEYYLTRISLEDNMTKIYPDIKQINTIIDKDEESLWIGTQSGVYLFNKRTEQAVQINIPGSPFIYSLLQTEEGILYIGTSGDGLYVYDHNSKESIHYNKTNSALLSDNISAILKQDEQLIISSDVALTFFSEEHDDFQNWTKGQGLNTHYFTPCAALMTSDNHFLFGSNNGVVELNKGSHLPAYQESKMVLSNFTLFYKIIHPGDSGSPLKKDINETEVLNLAHNQNFFSMTASSIDFDFQQNTKYSWQLEGFLNKWSTPGSDNLIRFTNVPPGKYMLRIRSIRKDNHKVIEERQIAINIAPPFWRSMWAIAFYTLLCFVVVLIGIRILYLKREQRIAKDKVNFFINTAHDIRTPLTLIKAPLEEIQEHEQLSEEGNINMDIAMKNVLALLRLTSNLINFERIDLYTSKLLVEKVEVNTFIRENIQSFQSYAIAKHITIIHETNIDTLHIWIDKEKFDSILKNIVANALKYTPNDGSITIKTNEEINQWMVVIADTGIGIPEKELKNAFKSHFRASNAINSKIPGSGLGMVMVKRLVELHKGKIAIKSIEGKGTTITMTFPKGNKWFAKEQLLPETDPAKQEKSNYVYKPEYDLAIEPHKRMSSNTKGERILIVEDNDELRNYLLALLANTYHVKACENGKEALSIVGVFHPNLIISDVMMPEMRGDELCEILKNDIETSHIPIILLTALNDEKHILEGLQTGADEYISKPFNVNILKATIESILKNRAILRKKYANLEFEKPEGDGCANCNTGMEWQFISDAKRHVEENLEDTGFTIDTLAAKMNMSRTSFYNKIKSLTDLSPSDYVRNIRLNIAAELLKEGRLNVTEVSEKTGFSDAKYFREVFKKHFGVSPSKYK